MIDWRIAIVALALALTANAADSTPAKVDVGPIRFEYPRLGPPWPKPTHPKWISKGIVFVGNWEPLAWDYRKNWQNWGNARSGAGAAALHNGDRTEETVIGLQKMGINMVLSSFHKGFGIENEKDTMAEAGRYAQVLHKHGMKLAVLVSTLLMYEDLYGEIPESKTWHRMLSDGQPDTYGNDGFRYRAYLNHPAYMNYMKRVCELAVKYGIDAIFFDTVRQLRENHHPLAEQMFREWLKAKYPDPDRWHFRTGLHYRNFIKIPHLQEGMVPLETYDQSIIQEYLDFKSQQITDFAAEMRTFIQHLNPEVALWFNTGGITGANIIDLYNMDHARLLPWLDLYYSEEQDYAAMNAHGGIVSKIRTIKAGERFGVVHTNAAGQPPPQPERSLDPLRTDPRLRLAEAMAFNRLSLGNMGYGATNVLQSFPETGRRYIRFYWDHFDLLKDCESAADIAVLRTFASMAYSNYATHRETILAEQALIQSQVPFDMLFDADLKDLSQYRVVILGDQESLSDAQVQMLRDYVRNGGSIVATADTSMYDDWRRQREAFGLRELFGIDRPPKKGTSEILQHEFGRGRAVYIPQLETSFVVPVRTAFTMPYWAPPKNTAQFIKALQWAGRDTLRWQIEAPRNVAAEAYHQSGTGHYIVHLVNYDAARQPRIDNIQVAIKGTQAKKVTAYSPDEPAPLTLKVNAQAGGVSFTLPHLGIYSIIEIE